MLIINQVSTIDAHTQRKKQLRQNAKDVHQIKKKRAKQEGK